MLSEEVEEKRGGSSMQRKHHENSEEYNLKKHIYVQEYILVWLEYRQVRRRSGEKNKPNGKADFKWPRMSHDHMSTSHSRQGHDKSFQQISLSEISPRSGGVEDE